MYVKGTFSQIKHRNEPKAPNYYTNVQKNKKTKRLYDIFSLNVNIPNLQLISIAG